MRFAIFGAGGVGGYFAAALARAGLTLALCRRARILFWAGVGALFLTAWSAEKVQTAAQA